MKSSHDALYKNRGIYFICMHLEGGEGKEG